MDRAKFVILGGGMVAGYAAKEMAEIGLPPGELAILSADSALPYERPPLSKTFLAGKETEESIRINSGDFYREHGIEVRLGCEVSGVDVEQKRLSLRSGGAFGYEMLLIATGARPRRLEIPGNNLANVYYLRTLQDAQAIRQATQDVQRALVIGGGFIAMEAASVLAQRGIGVTMVLREDRIWKRLFTPQMSSYFEDYYAARGVRLIKTAEIAELSGNGRVASATLNDGRKIPCELVVIGVGVEPVTGMLGGTGITVEDGILVNEFLETSRPGVLAAGDAACYYDVLFGKRRRVEHWDNAVSQGRHCARLWMGERVPFRHVPYFFSDVFDLSYEYWGDASGAHEVVHRGDVSSGSFSVWWLRDGILIAAFAMNRPDEERAAAPRWIETRTVAPVQTLADERRPLAS